MTEPRTVGSPTHSQRGDCHSRDVPSLMVTFHVSLTGSTGDSKQEVRSLLVGVGVCVWKEQWLRAKASEELLGLRSHLHILGLGDPCPLSGKDSSTAEGFMVCQMSVTRGWGGCGLRPLVCTRVWTIC